MFRGFDDLARVVDLNFDPHSLARIMRQPLDGQHLAVREAAAAEAANEDSMKRLALLALATSLGAFAQSLISGLGTGASHHLLPGDSAVLDLREPKKDLSCSIAMIKYLNQ